MCVFVWLCFTRTLSWSCSLLLLLAVLSNRLLFSYLGDVPAARVVSSWSQSLVVARRTRRPNEIIVRGRERETVARLVMMMLIVVVPIVALCISNFVVYLRSRLCCSEALELLRPRNRLSSSLLEASFCCCCCCC